MAVRILLGTPTRPHLERLQPLFPTDDVRLFVEDGRSVAAILAPSGDDWQPDLVVSSAFIFHPLPPGLGHAPYRRVLLAYDWHHSFANTVGATAMADVLLTDVRGVESLRAWDRPLARHFPLFAAPEPLDNLPEEEPTYDIGFIGTIHDPLYHRRNRWLAELIDLQDRWRVGLFTNHYGPAYHQILRQCRLVLNVTVRGEMNPRAYDVMAVGRTLLQEGTAEEAQAMLQDGEQCVFVSQETLAATVDHLLQRPAECRRIAKSGLEWVRQHTYRQRYRDLHALLAAHLDGPPTNTWRQRPAGERMLALALQAFAYRLTPSAVFLTYRYLMAAARRLEREPRVPLGMALCHAYWCAQARSQSESWQHAREAVRLFQAATALRPDYVLAWLTYGNFLRDQADDRAAVACWHQALRAVGGDGWLPFDDFCQALPRWVLHRWNEAAITRDEPRLRRDLQVEVLAAIARTESRDGFVVLEQAAALQADQDLVWAELAIRLARAGHWPRAIACAERAIALNPCESRHHQRLIRICQLADRPEQARDQLQRLARLQAVIHDGGPAYERMAAHGIPFVRAT